MATSKEIKTLIKSARKQGWRVTENGGHFWWKSPDGKNQFPSGTTESDYRAIKNTRSLLKRYGYKDTTK